MDAIFYVGFTGNVILFQAMDVPKAEMNQTPELFVSTQVCHRNLQKTGLRGEILPCMLT